MKYRKKIKPNWNNIYIVQDRLGRKLKKHEKGYIDSIKMVTGELLENSVKYYQNEGKTKPIEFCFSNNNGTRISILNQEIEYNDITTVTDIIDKIIDSPNPYYLYIERLQEILENRIKGESRLGLLRVASESGFNLSYEIAEGKLSISADRGFIGEEKQMKELVYEDLTIKVTEKDSYVYVSWIGKCRTLNPEHILDTYLTQVSQFLRGKKAIVSFEKLESMNSSTVPPLLTFIRALEENSVNAQFLYDDNEDWQRASFKPLSVITENYKSIEIKPLSARIIT